MGDVDGSFKRRLKAGDGAVIGTWLTLASPAVAEILAGMEPDWLLIDGEHSAIDERTMEETMRAIEAVSRHVAPLVRVAANDVALIKKALDRGAAGVLVPLVNSAEQAVQVVSACRYPPQGIRGVAGTRASRYGRDLPGYLARWNEDVVIGVQIETRHALDAVDAIAATEGVDLLFVGPNDLSASLGVFQQFDHPEYRAALRRVLEAGRSRGVACGIMAADAEEAARRIADGFRFVSVANDAKLLAQAVSRAFSVARNSPTSS